MDDIDGSKWDFFYGKWGTYSGNEFGGAWGSETDPFQQSLFPCLPEGEWGERFVANEAVSVEPTVPVPHTFPSMNISRPARQKGSSMKTFLVGVTLSMLATFAPAAEKPTPAPVPSGIVVENAQVGKVVTLSTTELAKLKHAELKVNRVSFSGVPLAEVLRAAGVAWGGNCSPLLPCYVVVEAVDGYRVVFSIPEIAPELSRKAILLADRCGGAPLSTREGPYKIIEEDAKQKGRWVRQVTRIRLETLSSKPVNVAQGGNISLPVNPIQRKQGRGVLYLVGMGPGDAELVTIKAARILKEADRVYCFDYLKDEVARYVPTERLIVVPFMLLGKLVGRSEKDVPANLRDQVRRSQSEIARFVLEVRAQVAAGKTLAFADAGDPTIYCPWSWILERCSDLLPTVVPGLSSFNAGNAALRRSITRHSGSILLTAGDDLGTPDANGRLKTTLVIFTQRAKLQDVVPRLAVRYPADTPIAVVCEASYVSEKVIAGTLDTILKKLGDTRLPHLYLIYAGDGLATSPR
jgi:precorrin-4 methylase